MKSFLLIGQSNMAGRGDFGEFPYCKLTLAKDLELKNDGIHFSSKSYRSLGKRYLEKYLEMV